MESRSLDLTDTSPCSVPSMSVDNGNTRGKAEAPTDPFGHQEDRESLSGGSDSLQQLRWTLASHFGSSEVGLLAWGNQ
uniref:HERPUD1 n=1 Tax=Panagrellus redivivus TaxID=6233 RepID=A0A7E4UW18_PANRE